MPFSARRFRGRDCVTSNRPVLFQLPLWEVRHVVSEVTAMTTPANSEPSVPSDPLRRGLCGLRRRARDPGLRHGQVFALRALDEGVAAGDHAAESGKISQYFLLPVRSPLHRRPRPHRLAIERLSILAAIAVADEQRWDGQERSTRYQDFKRVATITPDFGRVCAGQAMTRASSLSGNHRRAVRRIRSSLADRVFEYLANITPSPAEMKPEAYERTLRARAFDYFALSVAAWRPTRRSGKSSMRARWKRRSPICSRTPTRKCAHLGELLKNAATSPAYNANQESLRELVDEIRAVSPALGDRAEPRNCCGKSGLRPRW